MRRWQKSSQKQSQNRQKIDFYVFGHKNLLCEMIIYHRGKKYHQSGFALCKKRAETARDWNSSSFLTDSLDE
jgi:hypothetical protein